MSEKAVIDGVVPEGYSDRLYNEDLAPAEERRWGSYSIFALWMSDVHNLGNYTFAAGLFVQAGGISSTQSVKPLSTGETIRQILGATVLTIATYAALMLNFCDFSRFAPSN